MVVTPRVISKSIGSSALPSIGSNPFGGIATNIGSSSSKIVGSIKGGTIRGSQIDQSDYNLSKKIISADKARTMIAKYWWVIPLIIIGYLILKKGK